MLFSTACLNNFPRQVVNLKEARDFSLNKKFIYVFKVIQTCAIHRLSLYFFFPFLFFLMDFLLSRDEGC